ncbi:MAG: YicC/YloC family endoribonuclease [Thermodesulfobacteriota bacterium]
MSFPRSMTGFGRGDHVAADGQNSWTVEVKSVNHRFLDVKVKMSKELLALEEKIKKEVATTFSRGHVDVIITTSGSSASELRVDHNLAQDYCHQLIDLRKQLGLVTENDSLISLVATFPGVMSQSQKEVDAEECWQGLRPALGQALQDNLAMREQEGANLAADLKERLAAFTGAVERVEGQLPEIIAQRQQSLKERLERLLDEVDLDPARLAQEVVILTDKADVTEELIRLRSHISQFLSYLGSPEPSGRKLDFLLQEFLREVNTLASKINNSQVAVESVEMKNSTEKIREQVQNLE